MSWEWARFLRCLFGRRLAFQSMIDSRNKLEDLLHNSHNCSFNTGTALIIHLLLSLFALILALHLIGAAADNPNAHLDRRAHV